MRVDLDFFKRTAEIAEQAEVPMTEVTRKLVPNISLVRTVNPLESFAVFTPVPKKKP